IEQLVEENRELRRQLEKARSSGSADLVGELIAAAKTISTAKHYRLNAEPGSVKTEGRDVDLRVIAREVEVESPEELRALGDRLRERMKSGVAVLASPHRDRVSLLAVVTDDALSKGLRANDVIREVAKLTGGAGGGRPHMAQGSTGDSSRVAGALDRTPEIVRTLLSGA